MILVIIERLAGSYFVEKEVVQTMRLVEETEAHVVVRLLLLLLLGSLGGRIGSGTAGGSTTSSRGGTTSTTRWDGGELGGSGGDQLGGVSDCSKKCPGASDVR